MTRLLVLLLLCCAISAAAPVILHNNFGPANTFDPAYFFALGWGSGLAMPFVPETTAWLSSVQLGLTLGSTPAFLNLTVAVDNDGLPGTALESWVLTDASFSGPVVLAASALHPELNEGTTYWVTLMPTNISTYVEWGTTLEHIFGDQAAWDHVGQEWFYSYSPLAAFRVDGNDTAPEPATFAVAAVALAGLAIRRRRVD